MVLGAEDIENGRSEQAQMVCDIFSDIAPRYDLFNELASFGIHNRWLKEIARCARADESTRMLDIAAGTGDVTYTIARMTPPAAIVATDFCGEMLDVAEERARTEANGVPVTFERVDAMDLPYEDGSFDLVTVAYGLRNFDDRRLAMQEAARVLVPGGRYVALEFSTPKNRIWRAIYHFYLDLVVPMIGRFLTDDRSGFEYLRDSIKAFPAAAIIEDEMIAHGFCHVDTKTRTGGIVTIYTATK